MRDVPPGAVFEATRDDIRGDVTRFRGDMPLEYACAWHGYICALLIWDLISVSEHGELSDMLPFVKNNPVITMFTGWGDDDEEEDP